MAEKVPVKVIITYQATAFLVLLVDKESPNKWDSTSPARRAEKYIQAGLDIGNEFPWEGTTGPQGRQIEIESEVLPTEDDHSPTEDDHSPIFQEEITPPPPKDIEEIPF